MRTFHAAWTLLATLLVAGAGFAAPAAYDPASLVGTWAGVLQHGGETQRIALELGAAAPGRLRVTYDFPAVHFDHIPLGEIGVRVEGDSVRIGPFRFLYDSTAGELRGEMPHVFVPWYTLALTLRRADRFDIPARPAPGGREATPSWTYDAGSPSWAGPAYAAGTIYAGTLDGVVHALDARTGARRWTYRTGGPVRSRPVPVGGDVVVLADDNVVYRIAGRTGALVWRTALAESAVTRQPPGRADALFDRFGSDVAVAGPRLFVGTHAGDVVSLEAASGRVRWRFHTGGAVLAAPAPGGGRVFAGSFDGCVYALDAERGTLLWKRDTHGPVVSTPALAGGRAIVGNRAYDLVALDERTGEVAWTRYIWGSWVESSPAVRDGIAYVGSSDADAVYAIGVRDGRRVWATDVHGWAWGQPAVTSRTVATGVSGQVGYPVRQVAGIVAIERADGSVRWWCTVPAPASGDYGCPGSVAVGERRVYAAGLDGRIVALPE